MKLNCFCGYDFKVIGDLFTCPKCKIEYETRLIRFKNIKEGDNNGEKEKR